MFRAISVVMTGQQVFGEMMTHQQRANIVLTMANSWSEVWHLCARPALCRPSPVQTSIRLRQLNPKPFEQMLTASVTNHQVYWGEMIKHRFWRVEGVRGNCISAHPSSSFILQGEPPNQWHLSYLAFAAQFLLTQCDRESKCLGQTSGFGITQQIRW